MDQRLTVAQRNAVFDWLKRSGADPAAFEWRDGVPSEYAYGDDRDLVVSVLVHRAAGYYFAFSVRPPNYLILCKPGPDVPVQQLPLQMWDRVLGLALPAWARRVKECEAPDLWEQIARGFEGVAAGPSRTGTDEPFSPVELKLLDEKLDKVLAYVEQTAQPAQAQKIEIRSRFAYLKAAARRAASRIDWLNIFIGQIVSMGVERLIQPGVVHSVWQVAAGLLREIPKLIGG
jgi:hypothetical protein